MVYVNSKKFACESCIKGHRSSACAHTDRPLFEIKKKGRPVSQCTKCRELRQSKKLHSKCTCNHEGEGTMPQLSSSSPTACKSRRFVPIIPALPNGLRDFVGTSKSSITLPPDVRQRGGFHCPVQVARSHVYGPVDSLLNPCDCKSVWKCKCKESTSTGPCVPETSDNESTNGLTALALAAALRCRTPTPPPTTVSSIRRSVTYRSRPGSPNHTSHKRQKQDVTPAARAPGPDLAPILFSPSSTISTPMPDFAFMAPSMSEISSLAGSGCTCGVQCACPGCVEHRSNEPTSHERKDCADGCGICIDHSIMALPVGNQSQASSSTSFLDRFFARAAALPPPPTHRTSRPPGPQTFSFGVVNLPKLECCGGQCNCPAGQCTCRASCGGCCTEPIDARRNNQNEQPNGPAASPRLMSPRQDIRSCCAGKA
ncbi:hypothetical protein B0H34DRAFT_35202 [Crassisporium funariophilum]|nr:hypothetical protein B0H34DRAFT_35202 [Crassisporium funariophilum]